jgi:hypothetical protein
VTWGERITWDGPLSPNGLSRQFKPSSEDHVANPLIRGTDLVPGEQMRHSSHVLPLLLGAWALTVPTSPRVTLRVCQHFLECHSSRKDNGPFSPVTTYHTIGYGQSVTNGRLLQCLRARFEISCESFRWGSQGGHTEAIRSDIRFPDIRSPCEILCARVRVK